MSNKEKIQTLEENYIEYDFDLDGNVIGLWKMTTFAGDDCSEWLPFDDIINALNQSPYNHD